MSITNQKIFLKNFLFFFFSVLFFTTSNENVAYAQADTLINSQSKKVYKNQTYKKKNIPYSVGHFSGSMSYSATLSIPRGRNGLTPSVGIYYSSNGNRGRLPKGWSMPMNCIQRGTKFGVPLYGLAMASGSGTHSTVPESFYYMGAGKQLELVNITANSGLDNGGNPSSSVHEYRAKIESDFHRYRYYRNEDRWEIWMKNGHKYYMGAFVGETPSRYGRQTNPKGTFSWCVVKVEDKNQNTIDYFYKDSSINGGQIYLDKIQYNGDYQGNSHTKEVRFIYTVNNTYNRHYSYKSGARVTLNSRLLGEISLYVKHEGESTFKERRKLNITYKTILGTNGDAVIGEIQETGFQKDGQSIVKPATKFTYYGSELTGLNRFPTESVIVSHPSYNSFQYSETYYDGSRPRTALLRSFVDMNGDGRLDYVVVPHGGLSSNPGHKLYTRERINTSSSVGNPTHWNVYFQRIDGSFDDTPFQWKVNLGDFVRGAIRYTEDDGGGNVRTIESLKDMDGDGRPDYVMSPARTVLGEVHYLWCRNTGNEFGQCYSLNNAMSSGTGSFPAANYVDNTGNATHHISYGKKTLLDINGDGFLDFLHSPGNSSVQVRLNCRTTMMSGCGSSVIGQIVGNNYVWGPIPAFSLIYNVSSIRTAVVPKSYTAGGLGVIQYQDILDLNGDGLPDLLQVTDASSLALQVRHNDGTSFEPTPTTIPSVDTFSDDTPAINGKTTLRMLVDIDGDGLSDIVRSNGFTTTSVPAGNLSLRVRLNKGDGTFTSEQNWTVAALEEIYLNRNTKSDPLSGNSQYQVDETRHQILDLDGDGKLDFIYVDASGNWKILKGRYPGPYDIKSIDNQRGKRVHFTYKPSNQLDDQVEIPPPGPNSKAYIPFPVQVVSEVKVEDYSTTTPVWNTTTYKYSGGHYHGATREFRGFSHVKTDRSDTGFTLHEYSQDEYSQGLIKLHEIYDSNRPYFNRRTVYTIDKKNISVQFGSTTNPPIQFPYILKKETEIAEYQASPSRKILSTSSEYDNSGNLIRERNTIWGTCIQYTYKEVDDSSNYIVGLKEKKSYNVSANVHPPQDTPCSSGLSPERWERYYHDSQTDLSFISSGLLRKVETCKDASCASFATKAYSYTTRGLITTVTDENNHTKTITYDSHSNTYPYRQENAAGHVQYFSYDHGTDQVLTIKGPNATTNDIETTGETTKFEYDALGRLVKRYVPVFSNGSYGTLLREVVTYDDSIVTPGNPNFVQKEMALSSMVVREYFNGRGKVIQMRSRHGSGDFSVVDREIDGLGRLVHVNHAYLMPDIDYSAPDWNQPYTTYEYDTTDRLTHITHPGGTSYPGGVRTISYQPLQRTVVDETGRQKDYIYNEIGKLAQVVEHENVVAQTSFATNYGYTKWGDLEHIYDAENNHIQYIYNMLGQRIRRIATPNHTTGYSNTSEHVYVYDDAGNLKEKRDNHYQTILYDYDSINRIAKVTYPNVGYPSGYAASLYPLGANINYEKLYFYDITSNGPSQVGRLSKIIDDTGITNFVYNAEGQVIHKTLDLCNSWNLSGTYPACASSSNYNVDYEYNVLGQLYAVINHTNLHPVVIRYLYDAAGRPQRVYRESTGQNFALLDYYANGQIKSRETSFHTKVEYTYQAQRKFLKTIQGTKTNDPMLPKFLDIEYDYISSGHIQAVKDKKNNFRIDYEYDGLYRVIDAYSQTLVDGQPSMIAAHFRRTYAYSPTGNLTSRTTYDDNNPTTVNWSYSYGGTGWGANFHGAGAVTGRDQSSGNSRFEYKYDPNGNMKKRERFDNTGTSQEIWRYYFDIENRLRLIELQDPQNPGYVNKKTEIAYDYSGQKVTKFTVDYLTGMTLEDRVYFNATLEHNRINNDFEVHVLLGGDKLGTIRNTVASGSATYIYYQMNVKSTKVVTDENGDIADERGYYPFGSEFSVGTASQSSGLAYRFNGKEFDANTGFYDYGARHYSPELGRWLSSDKFMYHPDNSESIDNPQHLNLYSFSLNDPINLIDLDGNKTLIPPAGEKDLDNDVMERKTKGLLQDTSRREMTSVEAARKLVTLSAVTLGVIGIVGGAALFAETTAGFLYTRPAIASFLGTVTNYVLGHPAYRNAGGTIPRLTGVGTADPSRIKKYYDAMVNGTFQIYEKGLDRITVISLKGLKGAADRVLILDGHHRVTAALQYWQKHGDPRYITGLLKNAIQGRDPGTNTRFGIGYNMTWIRALLQRSPKKK